MCSLINNINRATSHIIHVHIREIDSAKKANSSVKRIRREQTYKWLLQNRPTSWGKKTTMKIPLEE